MRALKNLMERVSVTARGCTVTADHLPFGRGREHGAEPAAAETAATAARCGRQARQLLHVAPPAQGLNLRNTLARIERDLISSGA